MDPEFHWIDDSAQIEAELRPVNTEVRRSSAGINFIECLFSLVIPEMSPVEHKSGWPELELISKEGLFSRVNQSWALLDYIQSRAARSNSVEKKFILVLSYN